MGAIVIDDEETIRKVEEIANYLGVRSRIEAIRIAITEYIRKIDNISSLTQQ